MVYADAAVGTLIPTAVFGPSVTLFTGRLCALAHQAFLVLLRVGGLGAICLAMDIVGRILVDGSKPVQGALIDLVVIFANHFCLYHRALAPSPKL